MEESKHYLSLEASLKRQLEALEMEYDYEREANAGLADWSDIERKIQQGVCWFPLSVGRNYYNSLNQFVIEIDREERQEIDHNFEYGKTVRFFTTIGSGEPKCFNFSSTVCYVQEDRMVVTLPSVSEYIQIRNAKNLGVLIGFDETSYKTMFAALKEVSAAKGNRLAELRDILIGNQPVIKRELFPVRFPWLNPSQEKAINKVLGAKEVEIVHGPPGTGKTTTLVEAIYETLHRENQVLVCAQSNMAVDWISEKLVDRGVPVLRIGNPTRVNDKMLLFTYEQKFQSHPDYTELWSIRKAIREILAFRGKADKSAWNRNQDRLSGLRSRATELELKIHKDLFNEARVIACTLVGSANKVMTGHHFSTLFIDEAAQALEAACWVAIAKADRVIFAGDHQQLPPTIKCLEAAQKGLDKTLMQKVAERKPEVVSLLTVQYRMNNAIMRFSSDWFYQGKLKAAPEVENRGILAWDSPIEWIDTTESDAVESSSRDGVSRLNKREAELLVLLLQQYIEYISAERVLDERIDFGVISPYKAQVQYLRKLVKSNPFFRPFRKLITIHTVDGFQGQERDVIIISLVRANENGQIGFLQDLRRMNVAITRAKMKLMILGNAETLTRHRFYKRLYEYVTEAGKVIRLDDNENDNQRQHEI